MREVLLIAIFAIFSAQLAGAQQTLTPDQGEVTPGVVQNAPESLERADSAIGSRYLVNDGSFESGACDVVWECVATTICEWIVDPSASWGYPAYHGTYAAWLGGFCTGEPNSNSFCQDIWLSESFLRWRWMGYVSEDHSSNFMYVIVDNNLIYAKEMTWPQDHNYGSWYYEVVEIPNFQEGNHRVCFEFEANSGASMLIDYIEQGN